MDIFVKKVMDNNGNVVELVNQIYYQLEEFYMQNQDEYFELLSTIKTNIGLNKGFILESSMVEDNNKPIPESYFTLTFNLNKDKNQINTNELEHFQHLFSYNRLLYLFNTQFLKSTDETQNFYAVFFERMLKGDYTLLPNNLTVHTKRAIKSCKRTKLDTDDPREVDSLNKLAIISYFTQAMSNIRAFHIIGYDLVKHASIFVKDHNDLVIVVKEIEHAVRYLERFTNIALMRILKDYIMSISLMKQGVTFKDIVFKCLMIGKGTMDKQKATDMLLNIEQINLEDDDLGRLFKPTFTISLSDNTKVK